MKRWTLIPLVLLVSVMLSACSTGASSTSWPGLAADKDRAYLADGQYLYAVRLSDGVKVWQYPDKAGAEQYYSTPVLSADGKQLLLGSAGRDNALISLDPASGKPTWPVAFQASDHWVAPPLIAADTVYAANNNGTLYALKLATGEQLWSTRISRSLWGTPSTDGKLVFVTSLDHSVYAVDAGTHRVVWKKDLGGPIPGSALLAADGSALYVGSFARKLFAIEPATSNIRWTAELKDWVWNAPALEGDTLYAADISGNLYSLGAPNGKNAWPQVQPDGPITGSPLPIPGGVAVVTESGSVYAFKPDGTQMWKTDIGGKIYTTPVLAGDRILVAPMGAEQWLYAVNVKDGSKLPWQFNGK